VRVMAMVGARAEKWQGTQNAEERVVGETRMSTRAREGEAARPTMGGHVVAWWC
jgi:hypothetical protein